MECVSKIPLFENSLDIAVHRSNADKRDIRTPFRQIEKSLNVFSLFGKADIQYHPGKALHAKSFEKG